MTDGTKMTLLGKLVIFGFLGVCFYGAYYFFFQGTASTPGSLSEVVGTHDSDTQIEIGIAYGTEKRQWLEWAKAEFAKTRVGKKIQINLIPMGSLEGAKAVVNGDQRIHVWSPASGIHKKPFLQDWQIAHGSDNPILKEELLVLTPMVLVMWEERYRAFKQRYSELNFRNIADALAQKTGWAGIAHKPEWGLFKFGHTNPTESNSGLLTLVLMAYDYAKKCRHLQVADTVNLDFQNWLHSFEQAVSGLSNSTGNLMREMVLKGPSTYDALFVYENVAIDYLKSAQGRWGTLHVVYPEQNIWNDNPYYILNTPWSNKEHQEAAEEFLVFLLSEKVQKRSLQHGFRPGDPKIAVNTPDSVFSLYAQYGLSIDILQVCEAPSAEVIQNLLVGWQRAYGGR